MRAGSISPRAAVIASYALCGFANFGSLAILLGGIGGIAPSVSALLPVFERSARFHDARFTAPLRLESAEGGERFRMRARLETARSAGSSADAGAKP